MLWPSPHHQTLSAGGEGGGLMYEFVPLQVGGGSYLSCASVSFVLRQCFLFLVFLLLDKIFYALTYDPLSIDKYCNAQLKVGHSSYKQSCQPLF